MPSKSPLFIKQSRDYLQSLEDSFTDEIFLQVECLAKDLQKVWKEGKNIFICGNGGSAANAIHIANDLHYGAGACGNLPKSLGLKVEALSANVGVITCLANDTGYENIYSQQLKVKACKGDLLIVLSGSGNSGNIVNALQTAKDLDLRSYAILAFNGGRCKEKADVAIHFKINDMQIAEDTQLIIGHLCMKWLSKNKPNSIIGA